MKTAFLRLAAWADDTFWVVPAVMIVASVLAAIALVEVDRSGMIPRSFIDGPWLYNGGATGARTLLGAVASSTIGVAGTVFSITIAAMSLAAGQMGPRLLRNFTHDRGNQFTLGIFLGTFAYTLMVLRSVRTRGEGEFVPHLSLSVSIVLAFVCVGTLVYFVDHMASRINVDTVIDLVAQDVGRAMARLTTDQPGPAAPADDFWSGATTIADTRRGYLQHLDRDRLADWAAAHRTEIRLLARPGDFVFPGAPIASCTIDVGGIDRAIADATVLGSQRTSADDLEFAIRQLVEVAVRALSPGINDPHTAISVLDRLGAALCDMAPRALPSGVCLREGRVVLVMRAVGYDGLADAMLHLIRQNARGSVAVLIRMLEILTAAARCESNPDRLATLGRHAELVLGDAVRDVATSADVDDVRRRHRAFAAACALAPPRRARPAPG